MYVFGNQGGGGCDAGSKSHIASEEGWRAAVQISKPLGWIELNMHMGRLDIAKHLTRLMYHHGRIFRTPVVTRDTKCTA
eukprot:COSAG05_NODE_95_length_19507_cov_71.031791_8_plen_79_part_00